MVAADDPDDPADPIDGGDIALVAIAVLAGSRADDRIGGAVGVGDGTLIGGIVINPSGTLACWAGVTPGPATA